MINLAVVGATGMVGRKMLEVLAERKVPIERLYLFASAKSAGSTINYCGTDYTVIELSEQNIKSRKIDYALFSAGGGTSKEFAPIFASYGAVVIDNSSQWRMDPNVPLVVPEVNAHDLSWHNNIIANPNCSTIQAVVALAPLDKAFKIKRIVYSTYQAVSGAGIAGYTDLVDGINGIPPKKFPQAIAYNVIPHIDVFLPSGYTKEEEKMIKETRKILGRPNLRITATTVRVPVKHGHSESINVEFESPCTLKQVREVLSKAQGIVMCDDINVPLYPTPVMCENRDEVFVGRLRTDDSVSYGINMWVVADNIRKGAATNAIQILETLIKA